MKKKLQKINSLKIKSVYKYGFTSDTRNPVSTDPTGTLTISTMVFKL